MHPASRIARALRHGLRAALAVGVLTAGVTPATADSHKTAPTAFGNDRLSATALQYVGRWGGTACADARHDASGQCKQFVNCIVALVSGGRTYPVDPHGDYQDSYPDAGGAEVTTSAAVNGDIIQLGEHDSDRPLHSAIVLSNHHDGTFTVVDSNWVGAPGTPELVGVHDWTPTATARFWRLGAVAGQGTKTPDGTTAKGRQPQQAAPPQPPTLTTTAPAGLAAGTTTVTARLTAGTAIGPASVRFYLDGKPTTTKLSIDGVTTFALDTTAMPDGPHRVSAQTIAVDGTLSQLADDLALEVANTPPAVTATAPASTLVSGIIPITVTTAPPARISALSASVDGHPAASAPTTPGNAIELDTTTLAPGTHQVTVTATDRLGRTATSVPVPITVTAATGNRLAVDTTGSGVTDLIGTDTSGRLLRYPGTARGGFATPVPLWPDRSFGSVRAMAAGHFTTPGGPAQLIAIWADHTAHLYSFDTEGHLTGGALVTGLGWETYTRLIAGRFTGDGTSQILAITADGHTDLLTVAADGHTASADPLTTTVAAGDAAEAFAADTTGTGHDALLTINATGTVTERPYLPGSGFGPAVPTGTGSATAAPGTTPVAGAFLASGPEQILLTTADGSLTLEPATGRVTPLPTLPVTMNQPPGAETPSNDSWAWPGWHPPHQTARYT